MIIKNFESRGNLVHTSATPNIEEIGGLSSVEFYDVHSRHCQPSPVHHTSDIPVQSNVVQTSLDRLLRFIFTFSSYSSVYSDPKLSFFIYTSSLYRNFALSSTFSFPSMQNNLLEGSVAQGLISNWIKSRDPNILYKLCNCSLA